MKTSTDPEPSATPEPEAAVDAGIGPIRLLAGGGSAFEQRLLESARADQISHASREQLARALKVPAAPAPTAALGNLLESLPVGKLGAIAGLGAFALLAAWAGGQAPGLASADAAREPTVVAAPSSPAPSVTQPVSSAAGVDVELIRPGLVVDAPAASAASLPVAAADTRPRHSRVRVPARAAAISPNQATDREPALARSGLREELLALEGIQRLVRAGRTGDASSALGDYARRFPAGELRLEAELLGLDVSLARGERQLTRERARELLARPDAANYRERLEALWRAAGGGSDATRAGSESASAPHRGAEVTQ